ncbi:MAG: DUF3189 family protein [Bacillota bacterium]
MRVVYHCYGGTHSSVLGAALHLGLVQEGAAPSGEELGALPFFDKATPIDAGRLRLMGLDDRGNRVFFVGRRRRAASIIEALRAFGTAWGVGDWLFASTSMAVGPSLRLGGYLSRRLGAARLGGRFLVRGAGMALPVLARLVAKCRREALQGSQGRDLPGLPRCVFYVSSRVAVSQAAARSHLNGVVDPVQLHPWLARVGLDAAGNLVHAATLPGILEVRSVESWLSEEGLRVRSSPPFTDWDVALIRLGTGWRRAATQARRALEAQGEGTPRELANIAKTSGGS